MSICTFLPINRYMNIFCAYSHVYLYTFIRVYIYKFLYI